MPKGKVVEVKDFNPESETDKEVRDLMMQLGGKLGRRGIVLFAFIEKPLPGNPGMFERKYNLLSAAADEHHMETARTLRESLEYCLQEVVCRNCFGIHDAEEDPHAEPLETIPADATKH